MYIPYVSVLESDTDGEVLQMTDIFEGSIIRSFRRLQELLRQMGGAARAIGNPDLETKFEDSIKLLERPNTVVFNPSYVDASCFSSSVSPADSVTGCVTAYIYRRRVYKRGISYASSPLLKRYRLRYLPCLQCPSCITISRRICYKCLANLMSLESRSSSLARSQDSNHLSNRIFFPQHLVAGLIVFFITVKPESSRNPRLRAPIDAQSVSFRRL